MKRRPRRSLSGTGPGSDGINLHVYPSAITHESRIEKEVQSIQRLGVFEAIEVAGVQPGGLPPVQSWGAGVTIRRFASDSGSPRVARKVTKTVGFGLGIARHYSKKRVACINCHSVAALPACLLLKWRTGACLVYDTHELETETQGLRGLRKLLLKGIERVGLRFVDCSLFVTKSIEDWYLRTYALSAHAVAYNYPLARADDTYARPRHFHEKWDLPASTRIFLYQGVVGEARGVPELLETFADPPTSDVVLVVMGYGPLVEDVRAYAARSASIYFHEAVETAHLADYTRSADFGACLIGGATADLSLSYEYSGPNKLYQYIQAGIPVLASNIPEQALVLNTYPVGLLAYDVSVESVRAGVERLAALGDAPFREGLREAAEMFVWERYDQLFADLYSGGRSDPPKVGFGRMGAARRRRLGVGLDRGDAARAPGRPIAAGGHQSRCAPRPVEQGVNACVDTVP